MKVKISETFKIKNMILLSCLTVLIAIGLAKFIRYVMDRYVEIETEEVPNNWVDMVINKCLSDEFSEA